MTTQRPSPCLVSVHGGHSGQFCDHATGRLRDIIDAYVAQGFCWVGITEHIPPLNDDYLYPDEIDAGHDAEFLYRRFEEYISTCKRLKIEYSDRIGIYVAFETEMVAGSIPWIHSLVNQFEPDYVVGSVHYAEDIPFDYSPDDYARALHHFGGYEGLYTHYFDRQYEMIQQISPLVVGHFDLIRIFDPDYPEHLRLPAVFDRILRNLDLIKSLDLVMDFNMSAIRKGAAEPYIAQGILVEAKKLNIRVLPGDDSHNVDSVGQHIQTAIRLLEQAGFSTDWEKLA